MRIISKFHDYYDSALSHGEDKTLVYAREVLELEMNDNQKKKLPYITNYKSYLGSLPGWEAEMFYVGFCGRIYPVVQFKKEYKTTYPETFVDENYYFYSVEAIEEFCKERGLVLRDEKEYLSRYSSGFNVGSIRSLRRFFAQTDFMGLENVFADKNVPIFTYRYATDFSRRALLTLNPVLKDIQFFKFKDSFTCFQEISMFVGGVLKSPENKMVQISDEDKIAKHGYDKWSFRKMGKNSKK